MLFFFSNSHVSNAVMLVNGQPMNSERKKRRQAMMVHRLISGEHDGLSIF
jgi:hypothetical protein